MLLEKLAKRAALAISLAILPSRAASAGLVEIAAAADVKDKEQPKSVDPAAITKLKREQDPLQGAWLKPATQTTGWIRLEFDEQHLVTTDRGSRFVPGPAPARDPKDLSVRFSQRATPLPAQAPNGGIVKRANPPGGFAGGSGGARADTSSISFEYEAKKTDGSGVFVIHTRHRGGLRAAENVMEVPYKVDGDTLTLQGGVYDSGGPRAFKVELKGEWKRLDTNLETKLRTAFVPGAELDFFPIRLELRGQKVMIVAQQAALEADGRVRFDHCAVVRMPNDQDADKSAAPTTVQSKHALVKLERTSRSATDFGKNAIMEIEFANGVRLTFKEP